MVVTAGNIARQYLGVVLGIPSMQSDRLEIQATIEIDGGDDVSSRKCH
jgi:hypothetical protein